MMMITRIVVDFFIFFACSHVVYSDHDATNHSAVEIHISLMVSSAPTLNTLKVVEAVAKAVGNVNNDVDLLSGFNLNYSTLDTKVRLMSVKFFIYSRRSVQESKLAIGQKLSHNIIKLSIYMYFICMVQYHNSL